MSSLAEPTAGPDWGRPARGSGLGDRRGLTAAGGVLVLLGLGLVGGVVDVVTGNGLRLVFAVCFVAGAALVAFLVHGEDLLAAVVMPPLLYVVLALGLGALESGTGGGSFLSAQALEVLNALVLGAPVLVAATLAAGVVVLVRLVARRRS